MAGTSQYRGFGFVDFTTKEDAKVSHVYICNQIKLILSFFFFIEKNSLSTSSSAIIKTKQNKKKMFDLGNFSSITRITRIKSWLIIQYYHLLHTHTHSEIQSD